jgi:hypothetical protein
VEYAIYNPMLGTGHSWNTGVQIGWEVASIKMTPFAFGSMVVYGRRLLAFVTKELKLRVFEPYINPTAVLSDDNFRYFPRRWESHN